VDASNPLIIDKLAHELRADTAGSADNDDI
jgi:hypothetical protein